ncbi:MAG: N-succinylglutamate 5-semialdehyde dehydrogenase, partial [Alphaproteobacteria bacterium]
MTRSISTDPATGDTVWEGTAASPEEVAAAVQQARDAFPDWADRPRSDRIDAVKRYQGVLKRRTPETAQA